MTGGAPGDRDLDRTPTWAVASVCIVIILISIALEQALHRLGHWFTKKRMKAMFEALEKVKTGLHFQNLHTNELCRFYATMWLC